MESLGLFRNPQWLGLLVLPAALLLWTWRKRGGGVVLPLDHGNVRRMPWVRFALHCAESVPALLLALAILLLAGPQRWDEPRSKRALTNIQMCVDVSGSMMARFGDGDRYEAAMKALNDFVERRQGDAFGLTFFGNSVLHWVPLTTDISAFRCAPPFMHPRGLPGWFGGTEIGKALEACRKVLVEREEGDRMILLISDGQSSDLYAGRDEEIARKLKADGIAMYSVHIAEGTIPEEIVRIATQTGGEAFKPEDEAGLGRIFEAIDSMARARMEKTRPEASDHFGPWVLAGLGLLGAALLAALGLRATPW